MATAAGDANLNQDQNDSVLRESILLSIVALVPLSIGLGSGYLAFDNDTLYADVVRTMVRTGNWLDPNIHGVPFLDKPPLFFWISGLFVELMGDTTLAYRLPAALFASGTAGLIYFMLRRAHASRVLGIGTVTALLACPLFFEYSRRAYMEVPVACAVLVSIHFFHQVLKDENATSAWIGAGLWTGVGFMLKSLVGLFGALGFGALILVYRRWDLIAHRGLWAGLLTCACVCLPWHGYAYLNDPTVFLDFTYKLHVEDQVLDAQPWSSGPVWFYLKNLVTTTPLIGIATVLGMVGCIWRFQRDGRLEHLDALLLSALLVMLAVFSFSATKKVIYMLAFAPVACVLAGAQLRELKMPRRWAVMGGVALVALWLRNVPFLDPTSDFLRGSEPYAKAAQAIEGQHQATRTFLVDQYFSAAQFYVGLPSTSVWTQNRIVQQTQRIPYIRHGKNMVHVPRAQLRQRMLNTPNALWFIAEDDVQALKLLPTGQLRYRAGGLVVIETTQAPPRRGS